MDKVIPLADLLANVAEELLKAQKTAQARGEAVMQFEECEVEFAIKAEVDGKAGVKLYVVNIGGGVKRTEANTIRVKFKSIDANPLQASQQLVDEVDKPGSPH